MSGRGRMRGGMQRGGRGGRSSLAVREVRAPSSTTSITLNERFSAVSSFQQDRGRGGGWNRGGRGGARGRGDARGRGRGAGNGPEQNGRPLGSGSRKNQQLAARLQDREERRATRGVPRGGRQGRGRRGGVNGATAISGTGLDHSKIQQARRIANRREAQGTASQPGGRGRGLLRNLARGGGRGGGGGTGASRGSRGVANTGRGRGRGRGQAVKRGLGERAAAVAAVVATMGGVRRGAATAATSNRARGRGLRGRGRGGRGVGRGRGGGRPAPSRDTLDSEMDDYMAGNVNTINFD